MYPEPITPRPSQMNAREFVDALDRLICLRARADLLEADCTTGDEFLNRMKNIEEECEMVKRQLTDYLLAADGRKGLYAKGPNE